MATTADDGPGRSDRGAGSDGVTQRERRDAPQRTLQPVVFFTSAALIVVAVVLSTLYSRTFGAERLEGVFRGIQDTFSTYAGWIYVATVNACLIFAVWAGFSRLGAVRLGGPDARPNFSLRGWIAMLFSAGMGIGLVFWSVAEPIDHYRSPPLGLEPQSPASAGIATTVAMFHWGLHAWAIYAVVGLALAYAAFNLKLPLSIRSVFYGLLGERIHGPIGHTVDIIAVLATLFGLATSLGLGAQQVNAGLSELTGIPDTVPGQVLIIAVITMMAIASVVAGLDKGVRRLSEVNMAAAGLLLLFVFLLGPTWFLLDALVQNVGSYIEHLARLSTWTETYAQTEWQHSWTLFYWAWWIAWSPFVGMFIARVSYGRTVREFVLCVLLAPAVLTAVWLTVFGGAALHEELLGAGGIVEAVDENVATALFALLQRFPLAPLTQLLAVVVVVIFFVTSSDSGSLVIDTITSGGHPNPPVVQKVFWATTEGVVASALLLSGGLTALQAGAILTGLPFTFVLLAMIYTLYHSLRRDPAAQRPPHPSPPP